MQTYKGTQKVPKHQQPVFGVRIELAWQRWIRSRARYMRRTVAAELELALEHYRALVEKGGAPPSTTQP